MGVSSLAGLKGREPSGSQEQPSLEAGGKEWEWHPAHGQMESAAERAGREGGLLPRERDCSHGPTPGF